MLIGHAVRLLERPPSTSPCDCVWIAAAAALISSQASILDIALARGFESREAFWRAFRRRFRMSPSATKNASRWDLTGECMGLGG